MIFKRILFEDLLFWKASKSRKPMILRGARQVGKSTLIRQLGLTYSQFIELNLEIDKNKELFDTRNIDEIVEILFLKFALSRDKETLIFIDEIQESPKAIQLLRYFFEKFPELHVISAGSLLEFALKKVRSFPVGRVTQRLLNPLTFEEFIMASGNQEALSQYKTIPVKELAHNFILEKFHEYTIIGGMPEIVSNYIIEKSYSQLTNVYADLWQTYKDDIEKYTESTAERRVIRHIMETAHLEKDRIKFEGFGKSNYKSREVGKALRILDLSRVIQLIYPSTSTEFPIIADLKRSPRLQFLDTGLMNYTMGIQAELIGLKDFSDFYQGKVIQHIVCQQLQAIGGDLNFKTHFGVRENNSSNAEIDALFTYKNKVFPVEIKSGTHGKLKSLHQFIEQSGFGFGVRMSANNFSIEDVKTPSGTKYKLMNLPYYLAGKLPEYLEILINS